jgi:hypothetical protein
MTTLEARLQTAKKALTNLHGTTTASLTDLLAAFNELQSDVGDIIAALQGDLRRDISTTDKDDEDNK